MNSINFIKPVPPNLEREVRWWSWLTILSSGSILTIIGIYTGVQWHIYRSLLQEKKMLETKVQSFNNALEQQRAHTEEQEQLQKSIDAITKYKTSPKSPVNILTAVRAITGNGLQSIILAKNHFELHVACQNAHHATICLQKLLQDPHINTVKLTSLQSNQKQVIATFKGGIA